MDDRGFFRTLHAIRRQLAAMPNELYLIRLIYHQSRRVVPGERLWTAEQLANPATVRFLRARNRDGCDVYVLPYAGRQNAGYTAQESPASAVYSLTKSARAPFHAEPTHALHAE